MIKKIYLSVLVSAAILLVSMTKANSQDDNLEDKMRGVTGPELPTIDNIVQVSGENLDLLLAK